MKKEYAQTNAKSIPADEDCLPSIRDVHPTAKTQRQRIIERFLAAKGSEVPSYELAKIALQYNARVKELRALGFRITNRTERHNGKVFGFFRLETGPPPAPTATPPNTTETETPHPATDSLFGNLAPERYPD